MAITNKINMSTIIQGADLDFEGIDSNTVTCSDIEAVFDYAETRLILTVCGSILFETTTYLILTMFGSILFETTAKTHSAAAPLP